MPDIRKSFHVVSKGRMLIKSTAVPNRNWFWEFKLRAELIKRIFYAVFN